MQLLELIIKNKERFVQSGVLLPNIYLYFSVLMKLRLCSLLLLIYFALNSSVPRIDLFFFKEEFTLSVFSVCSFKESPDFGTSRINHTMEKQELTGRAHRVDFVQFYRAIRNSWEKPCVSLVVKCSIRWESGEIKVTMRWGKVQVPISKAIPIRWISLHFLMMWETDGETHVFHVLQSIPQDLNLMGKKHPYSGKSVSTNFPGFPHTMGFVGFSRKPISKVFPI